MDRRNALRLLGGALAAPLLTGAGPRRAPPPRALGIQLYTLREQMREDVEGTLARVAEIGYGEVEFAGYFGRPPAAVRDALDAAGLRAPAAHIGYDLIGDPWERTLAEAAAIGHDALIVPSLPGDLRSSLDGYRRVADAFNRAGEQARAAGLGFGFHNHDVELASIEGTVPLQLLIDATEPSLVFIELDVFWAVRGGADPIAFMTAPGRRVRMIHAKDMAADGAMVDVGEGTIDFARILEAGRAHGLEHVFVEHDQPASAFDTARAGHRHLAPLIS
jgi:sugar phosphate isomerase/epimerase